MFNNEPGNYKFTSLVIVDDEEEILNSLRNLFRKEQYNIHLFSSGLDALEYLKNNKAEVILSDMRMPEINGIEFLERAVKICPDSIRIIISGYEEKSVILNAISSGLARHYMMKPWEDKVLKSIVSESMEFQKKLRHKKLQKLLLSIRNLPSPPELHERLKAMLKKDSLSQKEIAIEIEKNPVLAGKIIRMSNSIFYSIRKTITSIYDALTFIGTESTLNLVLTLETFNQICSNVSPKLVNLAEEIRTKSVLRAQIAREIALNEKEKIDAQEAYTTGLMLDIGFILRLSSSPEKFEKYFNPDIKRSKNIFSIEKEIFEVTHDEVGEALLTYWNFPGSIISAVANHHSYATGNYLTTIVQIADLLVQGKDSYPHDPSIDILAEEWKTKLNMVEINKSSFFMDDVPETHSH